MPPVPELIVEERDGLRVAALVSARRVIDLAVDRLDQPLRYRSIWMAKVDRIVPHVGAFATLGQGAGLLRDGSYASGDRVIVQVRSVRSEGKADIVSEDIALPGNYFIYLPRSDTIGSSRRSGNTAAIASLAATLKAAGVIGGILRSGAVDASPEAVLAEAMRLRQRWRDIEERAATAAPGTLIEDGPDARQRLAADYPVQAVATPGITLDSFGLGADFASLLRPEIPLPRGGSVIVEETSALTAIDVNAATRRPEDADRDALAVIAEHIRLRNLSGLIVIDFASAAAKKSGEAGKASLDAVRRALADDPAGCRVAGRTPSGLVELTRPARDLPLAVKLRGHLDAAGTNRR